MTRKARLEHVLAQIEAATRAAGRPSGSVRLIGVTKTRTPAELVQVVADGLLDLGANYVEESLPAIAAVKAARFDCTWHFIGHLQANKTRAVAEHFAWLHTLDRLRIAQRLSAQRPGGAPPLNLLLQVNFAREASKGGIQDLDALRTLAQQVQTLPNLQLRGLMTIPPASAVDPQPAFAELAAALAVLRADQQAPRIEGSGAHLLDTLSMGMSADFAAAIAAGATMVRIGTALFGPRPGKVRPSSAEPPPHPST